MQRLKDRKASLSGLVDNCDCGVTGNQLTRELESLLLDPEYIGFVQAALAISDQYERGLVADLTGFQAWCDLMATRIAG